MHGLNNINFNTISYDAGLTLVKEAKESGIKKNAQGPSPATPAAAPEGGADGAGALAAVIAFIKRNPEFLTRLGIGTAIGGGLGVASGLMGEPRSRKPLRRGLTGALLGALGGGMWGAMPELSKIYGRGQAVNAIKDLALQARDAGMSRDQTIESLTELNKTLGSKLSPEEIANLVPLDRSKPPGVIQTLLDTKPDPDSMIPEWEDLPGRGKLAIGGGIAGGLIGNPIAHRRNIMRVARSGHYAGVPNFADKITTGHAAHNQVLADAVDLLRGPRQRSWHMQNPLHRNPGQLAPRVRSPINITGVPRAQADANAIARRGARQTVFDAMGRPRSRGSGASLGAGVAFILPDLIRAARRLWPFGGSSFDMSDAGPHLKTLSPED